MVNVLKLRKGKQQKDKSMHACSHFTPMNYGDVNCDFSISLSNLPSFSEGVSRVTIFPDLDNISLSGEYKIGSLQATNINMKMDKEVLAQDWLTIGSDLYSAFDIYGQNFTDK